MEADLIGTLVERDATFYDPQIVQDDVAGLSRLAMGAGLIEQPMAYAEVVASQYEPLWSGANVRA